MSFLFVKSPAAPNITIRHGPAGSLIGSGKSKNASFVAMDSPCSSFMDGSGKEHKMQCLLCSVLLHCAKPIRRTLVRCGRRIFSALPTASFLRTYVPAAIGIGYKDLLRAHLRARLPQSRP